MSSALVAWHWCRWNRAMATFLKAQGHCRWTASSQSPACRERSRCCVDAPVRRHLGDNQFRHLRHQSLDFLHASDHVADAFWVADPVVLKAFWCAGELDRSSHPIPPERSTMRWPKEIPWSPKHLFMQPRGGDLSRQWALVYGASCVTVRLKARSLR